MSAFAFAFAPTPSRLAAMPGFWKRSVDEFKRQAKIAVRMEGLHVPTKPYHLSRFETPDSVHQCKIMCDSDMGGFSQAALTFVDGAPHRNSDSDRDAEQKGGTQVVVEEEEEVRGAAAAAAAAPAPTSARAPAHALFKGTISTDLPPNKPNIQRSGYAGWRTRDRGMSLFGKLLWDLSPYAFLALRIRSDGRKYFVNFQTESIVPTDLHQHLLPASSPGQWETVTIPFSAFVRTNYGHVVEPQKEMMSTKVRSVGISLIDRVPGPFELAISDVYATNRPPAREVTKEDSGFDLGTEEDDQPRGMMDEIEPRPKKGEPDRILI